MAKQIKHTSGRKIRSDMKVSEVKYQGSMPPQPTLTKKRFEALLVKGAPPKKCIIKSDIFPLKDKNTQRLVLYIGAILSK